MANFTQNVSSFIQRTNTIRRNLRAIIIMQWNDLYCSYNDGILSEDSGC